MTVGLKGKKGTLSAKKKTRQNRRVQCFHKTPVKADSFYLMMVLYQLVPFLYGDWKTLTLFLVFKPPTLTVIFAFL